MKFKLIQVIIMLSKYALYGFFAQLFLFNIIVAENANGQKMVSVKEIGINLNVENSTISKLFKEIENKTNFKFSMDKFELKSELNNRMSIDENDILVSDVLMEISKRSGVMFKQVNNNINVRKIKSSDRTSAIIEVVSNQADVDISGKIIDENGEGLPGASIIEKGTTNGVTADLDGNYKLNVPDNAILAISYVGYVTQELEIAGRSEINITMALDAEQLDEIVVIGYGTVKRANVTNSVAKINSEALENRPLTSLSEAFSGQIAGVYAQQASGLPGADFEIKIRGTNSITSGSGPLYVIDGMPVQDMKDLNMANVASIEVLKDASAAAIYGARGAGGIVLITTKSAKSGETRVDFEAYTGVQAVSNKIDIMNADQWVEYAEWNQKEKYRRDGKGDPFADPSITFDVMGNKYHNRKFWYNDNSHLVTDTDWQDEGLQAATKRNYALSLSKGVEGGSFVVSGNYLDQEGLFKGTSYKRYNFSSNSRYNVTDKLEVGVNLSASHSLAVGETNGEGKESPYMRLIVADPTAPVDGNVRTTEGGLLTSDPNPIIQSQVIKDDVKTTRTIGNVFVNYEIIEGLKIGGKYGLDTRSIEGTWFKPQYVNKKDRREGDQVNTNNLRTLIQGTLSYDKTIDKHSFSLLAGTSFEEFHQKRVNIDSWDFASDDIHTFNTAATFRNWNDTETEWSLLSFFGRASYNFNDRYLASASIRRDGSSRFGKDNRFGVFPAVSAAWRISEEAFFQDVPVINNLKLRVSWGQTGNDNIGNYSSFGGLTNSNYSYGGSLAFGFAPTGPDNPTLTWETNTTTDFGLDMGFLGNRITISADYYINNTENLLLDVPAPAISGFPGSVTLNSGSVRNKGIEFELASTNIRSSALGGLTWRTRFNMSHNSNEVTGLGGSVQELIGELRSVPTHITTVGLPIGSFFLYESDGVLSEADMANDDVAKFNKQEAGNIKIVDQNGDKVINDADRTVVGSNHPSLIYGMTNSLKIGNFDFSVLLTGVTGFESYFMFGRYIDSGGTNRNQMTNWTNGYRSAAEPGDGQTPYPFGANPEFTDRWLYKGDYIRVKNLTFGYTLPAAVLDKLNMRSLRAYFSADNLFNSTDFPGGNPESNSYSAGQAYTQGTDYGTFPLTRTYVLGVKMGF